VPRSSVSLVLGFRVRVRVSLLHLRTIAPSDYRYTIPPTGSTAWRREVSTLPTFL